MRARLGKVVWVCATTTTVKLKSALFSKVTCQLQEKFLKNSLIFDFCTTFAL